MKQTIKIKLYNILSEKVGEACSYASKRIYKHTSMPDEALIEEIFHDAVMQSLTEVIDFEDDNV